MCSTDQTADGSEHMEATNYGYFLIGLTVVSLYKLRRYFTETSSCCHITAEPGWKRHTLHSKRDVSGCSWFFLAGVKGIEEKRLVCNLRLPITPFCTCVFLHLLLCSSINQSLTCVHKYFHHMITVSLTSE